MIAKTKKKTVYNVVVVEPTTEPILEVVSKSAEPPRYVPERDEPAFNRAWDKVALMRRERVVKEMLPVVGDEM